MGLQELWKYFHKMDGNVCLQWTVPHPARPDNQFKQVCTCSPCCHFTPLRAVPFVFERESFFFPPAGELPGGDGNAAFVGISPLFKRSRIARWCFPGAQLHVHNDDPAAM